MLRENKTEGNKFSDKLSGCIWISLQAQLSVCSLRPFGPSVCLIFRELAEMVINNITSDLFQAVSDLLLGVFCMPFTLLGQILKNFVFGLTMCKLIPYFQGKAHHFRDNIKIGYYWKWMYNFGPIIRKMIFIVYFIK